MEIRSLEYDKTKNIPNVSVDDVYTGNGVSELITLSMQGLLDYGDEILVPWDWKKAKEMVDN